MDRIFCHFGCFCPLTTYKIKILKKWKKHLEILSFYTGVTWQSYDVWFLRYHMQQTEFFVILDHFLPFYPLNNPKNPNFEKMNKTPGDIIILHICTRNDNHIIYGSWDVERDGHDFCHFGPFFALLPPNNPKNQNSKKMKKHLEILSFYTSIIYDNHFTHVYHKWQSYDLWFLRYGAW